MTKKIKTILVDQDAILVNMLEVWIQKYNQRTNSNIQLSDIKDYYLQDYDYKVLEEILHESDFFYNLDPMPHAVKYLQKLIDIGYDVVIVTQPPRKSDFAMRDKRKWMKRFFPEFSLANMIFCHRKDMVRGDLLFDDKPDNLIAWKKANPESITATIEWEYNKDTECDWRFKDHETAWSNFFEKVTQHNENIG